MSPTNGYKNQDRDRLMVQLTATTAAAAAAAAVVANDIIHIKTEMTEIKSLIEKMDSKYLTRREFEPVKTIVYGLVSIILIAVAGALIALVVFEQTPH